MPLNEAHLSAGTSIPPVSSIQVPSVDVLGVRFHSLTMDEALDLLEKRIELRKPAQITFANAQTVAMCWQDRTLRAVINRSDYTFPDGMSIVWGGRWLKKLVKCRLPGPDVTSELCRRAAARGYGVFLLGTSDENLAALKGALERKSPGLRIVGTYSPPMSESFSPEQSAAMVNAVNASRADVLLVGLSCPKQERWIGDNLSRLTSPVNMGVGAAFDFLSGRIPRAPEWFQDHGFEWVYRLWCEPRRLWKRYLWGNLVFLTLLSLRRLRLMIGLASENKEPS